MTTELKGWHVLVLMLGFFGITIAVNVALAIYAIDTFSGEDEAKPYLRGLAYNRTLEERAVQAALGWSATIDAENKNDGVAIATHIVDRNGQARSALTVEAILRRPTDARLDRVVELAPAGNGDYEAMVSKLAPGIWDVIVRAKAGDTTFVAERRVTLQ